MYNLFYKIKTRNPSLDSSPEKQKRSVQVSNVFIEYCTQCGGRLCVIAKGYKLFVQI